MNEKRMLIHLNAIRNFSYAGKEKGYETYQSVINKKSGFTQEDRIMRDILDDIQKKHGEDYLKEINNFYKFVDELKIPAEIMNNLAKYFDSEEKEKFVLNVLRDPTPEHMSALIKEAEKLDNEKRSLGKLVESATETCLFVVKFFLKCILSVASAIATPSNSTKVQKFYNEWQKAISELQEKGQETKEAYKELTCRKTTVNKFLGFFNKEEEKERPTNNWIPVPGSN